MSVNYSTEQKAIITAVLAGNNCIVNAVAGSGKTTTVMGLAEFAPEKQIVQITYNRHLKDEVSQKIKNNAKIKSGETSFNDDGTVELWEFIKNNKYQTWSINKQPDLDSDKVGALKENNKFKVLEKKDIWFRIKYRHIEGWIRWKIPPEQDGDHCKNTTAYVPNKYIQKCFSNTNLSVYTYHGLCVKFYNKNAYNDSVIDKVVLTDKKPSIEIPNIDILVIDETQDMTVLYYKLIKKFIKDCGKKPTILLLGDVNQGIYEFKKSDKRFLSMGDSLFTDCGPFLRLTLRTSYRLTNTMADFINEIMLDENRIVAQKSGPKVAYIRADIWSGAISIVSKIISDLLASNKYKCDDIFVLSPSVVSKKIGTSLPINKLENGLVSKGIQCFTSLNDESLINKDIVNGKLVFSTFHQAKGRERPIVIVYGFDSNWFKYYGKNKDQTVCPNELYVAATRASEHLILVEGIDANTDVCPLPFLKYINSDYELFKNKPYLAINGQKPKIPNPDHVIIETPEEMRTNPSDMLKFLSDDILRSLVFMKEAIFKKKSSPQKNTDIPVKIKNNIGLYENVSDINGLAIPMIWETKQKGTSTIYNYIVEQQNLSDIVEENFKLLPTKIEIPADFLRLANIYQAIVSGYHFKLAQICDYNWLTQELIDECHNSMNKYLDESVVFEKEIKDSVYKKLPNGHVSVSGRIDAYDNNAVYEFKCVNELTIEHFLQLVVYAWLWKQPQQEQNSLFEQYGSRKFLLINIRTDEIHELDPNSTYIDDIVDLLISHKFMKNGTNISDADFLKRCLQEEKPQNNVDLKISESVSLSLLRVDELKQMCKIRGIKVGKSSKPDLIEKILNYKPDEEKPTTAKKAKKSIAASQTIMKEFLSKGAH